MVDGPQGRPTCDGGGDSLNRLEPTPANVTACAEALKRGELVVMPTETVYGLGARALDAEAVRQIFAVKGRPADNPLIVHVARLEQVSSVVREWPEVANRLAEAFWPGPLTLVLPKQPEVPDAVTAGLDTVGIRVPDHPVALRLIDALGEGIAAPSANPFMALSPTAAEHIAPSIAAGVFGILDGGPCEVGVESTVLDLSEGVPRLLRPGGVSRAEIEAVLDGPLAGASERPKRSPGQYRRHYAPLTPVEFVSGLVDDQAGLVFGDSAGPHQITMPHDPVRYAVSLYASLHRLDALGLGRLYVQSPPDSAAWEVVWDRLRRMIG